MLARLFRRHRPQLPSSSAELAEALRAAAPFADSDDARQEYLAAADALDRAITITRQHGDEPTRDALAYALGRAELNLKDQLSELIEVSKETHVIVQGVQIAQSSQEAAAGALWAAFQSFSESLTQWRDEIERWRATVDATLSSYAAFRTESKADRGKHTEQLDAISLRLQEIEGFIQQIKALMANSPTPEKAEQYRAFLDALMDEHEAGG